MSFQRIWKQLCSKKPSLLNPNAKAEFTPDNLKRLLEQVHSQGVRLGRSKRGESTKQNPRKDEIGHLEKLYGIFGINRDANDF